MKKERIKRIACWAGVITLLLSTIFAANQSVHAVSTSSAQGNIATAAKVQSVMKVFKECVSLKNGTATDAGYKGSEWDSDKMMDGTTNSLGFPKAVATGLWLENEVQRKVNNGSIYCSDNSGAIVGAFLNLVEPVLDNNIENLLCNGDESGLLKVNGSSSVSCSAALKDPNYQLSWNRDGSLAYLEKIYNDYLSAYPEVAGYLPGWSDIDNISNPELKYYLYLNEFKTGCVGDSSSSNGTLTIKEIDSSTGEIKEVSYPKSDRQYSWGDSVTGESGATTCDGLAGLINRYSESVASEVEDAIIAKKKQCNSDLVSRANDIKIGAQQIIRLARRDPEAVSEKDLSNAQKALEEINALNGQYWKEESDGNVVCVTLPSLSGGTSSGPGDENSGSNNGNQVDGDGNFTSIAPTEFNVDACYDAADSLGWILCPLIKGVASAADGIYTLMIEPFLNVRTGSEGLKNGWSAVRNIANIGFAIMFAVVILSQLTGIGLSNYNIKKILPKLIMVAVLVNLSYILCQLAVDLSNILGVQLHEGLAEWGNEGSSGESGGPGGWSILSTAMTTLFGGAGVVGLVVTFPFWIIPFLLSLVSAAVSVLFFFAILAVREVAVIVLIVLAPAAIVCYALPNTKSIFNKWKSAFTSVLLVFPLCGALIGGGKFASAVLVSDTSVNNSNFLTMLMAMLIQVIPFFMIPSLLKKSLAAIGNVGAKISTMGSKVGGFASRQLGHTRKIQDFNDSLQRNANQRRDIKLGNKLKAKENSKVKSYEEQLLAKGIDLNNAEAVKRELGSSDYREYKKLKTQDNNRRRRLAQVGHRIERMAMEDIESRVASEGELMTPQSERYQRMLTNRLSKQVSAEASALESLYASGKATKIDGQGTLDVTNMAECIQELGKIVEKLNKNPEDTDAKARMQALTTVLAKSGEPGENALRSVLLDQVHKNVQTSIETGDKSSLMAENNMGLRAMSNFMIDKFGGQLKADDRDTFDLANALKNSDTYQEEVSDAKGNMKRNDGYIGNIFQAEKKADGTYRRTKRGDMVFAANKYDFGSATKISEQALAGANDAQLDRIHSAIESGALSGQQLQDFMSLADRTLHNENINLKIGVRSKLERMQMAAYAQNADALQQHQGDKALQRIQVNQNSADILTKAENSSLDNMIGQIKTTDVSQISEPSKRSAKIDEMRGIAANAKYALENYSLPTAKAERLQEIISSVQNNASVQAEIGGTLTDFSGNGRASLTGGGTLTANSQQIRLRDAKPAPQKVQMPSSWMSSPNAPDGYVVNAGNGNFRNLNDTERQWLKDARSYNNRIDFENQNQQNNQSQQNNQNNP